MKTKKTTTNKADTKKTAARDRRVADDGTYDVLRWVCRILSAYFAGPQSVGGDREEDPARYLVRALLDKSRYDFSGYDIGYRRRKDRDGESLVSFDVFVGRSVEKDGETLSVTEVFPFSAYGGDMARSVAEFDAAVAGSLYFSFKEKEAVKCGHACPGKCASACGRKDEPEKPAEARFLDSPKALREFKAGLIAASSYRIPRNRFQVHPVKVDKKSRKYVYELRFFQKDYTKTPAETQSYEAVPFRVRMVGDTAGRIAKRFDKAVEGLRFNEFAAKAKG